MLFHDIESNDVITIDQLFSEYSMQSKEVKQDQSFDWYVHNSLTQFGGTLEIIDQKKEIKK